MCDKECKGSVMEIGMKGYRERFFSTSMFLDLCVVNKTLIPLHHHKVYQLHELWK